MRNPLYSRRQQIEISLALQVSFAELVTVFVLEELRSSVLREWVEAQHADSAAADDTSRELSDEHAAMKIQAGFRGSTARKDVAATRRENRQAQIQSKYDDWHREGQAEVEG